MKMKVDNTLEKLNYIINKGFDVTISNFDTGMFLELSNDYKTIVQEKDIDLPNVVDKTYKILREGGYQ